MLVREYRELFFRWQKNSISRLSSCQRGLGKLETLESKMLSILIPNHNEDKIHEFVNEVELTMLDKCEIIIARDQEGKGKGWAIREALSEAKGDLIAFIDGDGDIEPRMLWRLFPFLIDFDVVVGSKRMTNAPLQRKIITHLSRIYIKLMFGISVETQTGIKLFHRSALRDWKSDSFAFDFEILWDCQKRGLRMIEIPIEAEIKEKMSRRALWRTLIESLRLKFLS